MLRTHHNGVDASCHVVVVIFHRHLAFGIGSEIGHFLPFASDFSEDNHDVVCEAEGKRHEVVSFVVGIAEHHALVPCPLCEGICIVFAIHASIDVSALFVDGTEDATTFGFEFIGSFGVADSCDGVSHDLLQVDVGIGAYFARHHHLSRGHEGFTRHLGLRVKGEEIVEDGVRDLVRHFVGMSFRHRF